MEKKDKEKSQIGISHATYFLDLHNSQSIYGRRCDTSI